MVVLYLQFDDVTAPAGRDAAWVADRFFGSFPSVADYFADDSFGELILTPAPETNTADNGTADDGVVVLNMGDRATFFSNSDEQRNRLAVDAADPFVNFAAFDSNGNGTITDAELIVEVLEEDANASGGCGIARGVASGGQLDGKNVGFSVAMDNTATNLMTIIHETGHVAFHMRDLYGFGVGSFDISGPTCGPGDDVLFRTSAWQKMHIGWSTPTVVVEDGFYEVNRAALAGESFILYDPSEGTNDYYMVENRARLAGTYDQRASDTGLVVWKIDEAEYSSGDDNVRPIEIQRPDGTRPPGCGAGGCYGGSNIDAWNPEDMSTPQRTFDPTGGPEVAVRAVPAAQEVMRVFFDVRGPGVLVDPSTAQGRPIQVNVTPEETKAITFPVLNTGEATDSFDFTLTGLPSGWTASTDTRSLGDHVGAVASVSLVPEANAPTGITEVAAVGRSTSTSSIASSSRFRVNVVLDRTVFTYTGATSVPTGEPAGFEARVNNPDDPGNPTVPGIPVTFSLSNGVDNLSTTVNSNAAGLAVANPLLAVPPGNYDLTVSSPRVGKHAPASTTVPYTVERRPTVLEYGGDATADYSDPANVSATLTDALSGSPLAGKSIDFSIGTQSTSEPTDSSGIAAGTIVLSQSAGNYTVDSSFAGDATYLPSADSDPFEVTKETLSFTYDGDTLVEEGTTPRLSAQATEEPDGSPGDLSLAEARFQLSPTLTAVPFSFLTGVDAGGDATVAATGLPVDLWTVDVKVPNSNLYWTGSSSSLAELVLYDPDANISGGGYGDDGAGKRAKVNLTGKYMDSQPRGQVQLDFRGGIFKGSKFDWIVSVGDQAIFQIEGAIGPLPMALRLRMLDAAEPGVGADQFRAVVKDALQSPVYDSDVVTLRGGNLQTR